MEGDIRILIRKCVEPTDLNYGGYDLLAFDGRGAPYCFAELGSWERVLDFLNDRDPILRAGVEYLFQATRREYLELQ